MISLGPATDALAKLKPPALDSVFLKQSLDLAKSGSMFQNPLGDSFRDLDNLSLSNYSSLSGIPGCGDLAAKAAEVTASTAAVKGISDQMFTKVMPTMNPLPDSLLNLHPNLDYASKKKLQDFTVPSVTDIMSSSQSEQQDNERMGITGGDPCLPVQKTMESTMKAARKVDGGVAAATASHGLKTAITDIQNAWTALQKAEASAVAGATAALNALIDAAHEGLSKIGNLMADMGHSLIDSVKSVQAATEKSMMLATASMTKDLVKNNPCMKSVLSPGDNVHEFTTTFTFTNLDVEAAALMLDPANLKFHTFMSSIGYEQWKYEYAGTKINDTQTDVIATITFSVDVDKAKSAHVSYNLTSQSNPFNTTNSTFIDLYDNTKAKVGRVILNLSVPGALDGNYTIASNIDLDITGSSMVRNMMTVSDDVVWTWAKKKGLLSPEMQKMTEPAKEPDAPIEVTAPPVQVTTEAKVAEKKAADAKAIAPPAVQQEAAVVVPPEPIIATTQSVVFTDNVSMRKVKDRPAAWAGVTTAELEHYTGDGRFKVTLTDATYTLEFDLDSTSINKMIAEMTRRQIPSTAYMYYQMDICTLKKADGSVFGRFVVYNHMLYNAETKQVLFKTEQKSGESKIPLVWDTTLFG